MLLELAWPFWRLVKEEFWDFKFTGSACQNFEISNFLWFIADLQRYYFHSASMVKINLKKKLKKRAANSKCVFLAGFLPPLSAWEVSRSSWDTHFLGLCAQIEFKEVHFSPSFSTPKNIHIFSIFTVALLFATHFQVLAVLLCMSSLS